MSRWPELPDDVPLTATEVITRPVTRLGIGDYKVTSPPELLSAIGLGSCVSVFLSDTTSDYGAASHFMLPEPQADIPPEKEWRYVDVGLPRLIESLAETADCTETDMGAYIVGGSNVLPTADVPLEIGKQNLTAVDEILCDTDINIEGRHTGGEVSRTVVFAPGKESTVVLQLSEGVEVL